MPIAIECNRCGHAREITRAELVRGGWQHRCPVCRVPSDDEDRVEHINSIDGDEGRHKGKAGRKV